jgi:hypothetical protein
VAKPIIQHARAPSRSKQQWLAMVINKPRAVDLRHGGVQSPDRPESFPLPCVESDLTGHVLLHILYCLSGVVCSVRWGTA